MRPFLTLLLIWTLGAAAPSTSLKKQADRLDRLEKDYWALALRLEAVLMGLRDFKAAFPSSPDPELLLPRWQTLKAEGESVEREQDHIRTQYRETLQGTYLY